jgi:glucokinase
MENKSLVVCADVGGTHITAALVDVNRRMIVPDTLVRERVNSHGRTAEIIDIWSRAIAASAKNTLVDKVSIAMPGPFDYEKGISLIRGQDKYDSLYNLNVKELLAENLQFKKENIFLINDAASFLQGEVFAGAAIGFEKAIGVTLGTGLGSCIFENHVSVDAGLWRMPFSYSIAEDYLCTRWFIKRYYELAGSKVQGVSELLRTANQAIMRQIFNEFGDNLAKLLTEFISVSKPEVVVIGGNIAKAYKYFEQNLIARLGRQYPNIPIKTAELGEEAALLGAASYWDTRNSVGDIPIWQNHIRTQIG